MSGLECIAAILGVAGTGIDIASRIYDFSSTTTSAREDMRMIAESIDTFSSVLETLGRQLETSEAICSKEGLKLARELEGQSTLLFGKIAEHIPSKNDDISARQKLAWYFQKSRVTYLLSQVEQLKSTVSLLLQILILAQTTKPRTPTNVTSHNVTNNVNINVNIVHANVNSQFRRAENRVMQYHDASIKFAKLQIQEEEYVLRNALPWQDEFERLPVVRQTDHEDDLVASFGRLVLRQPRASMEDTSTNSAQMVSMLLDHWTTIDTHLETTESTTFLDMEEEIATPLQQSDMVPEISVPEEIDALHATRMSRADTMPDSTNGTSLASSNTEPPAGSKSMFTGWWQRYRSSQKTTREEEERNRQLEKQENELKRRETQVQREQALLDRELKLREAEKQTSEAQVRALAEREKQFVESQKLKEAEQKQALAAKEMRAQTELRQREARKEHLARLRDIRQPVRDIIPPSVPLSQSRIHRPATSKRSLNGVNDPPYESSPDVSAVTAVTAVTASTDLVLPSFNDARPIPTRSATDYESIASSESDGNTLKTISSAPGNPVPLDRVSSVPQNAKAARKQRREEWKQNRKAAKHSKPRDT